MGTQSKPVGEGFSDETLLWGGGLFVAYGIWKKMCVFMNHVLSTFWGRMSLSLVIATSTVAILFLLKREWHRRDEIKKKEKAILGPGPGSIFVAVTEKGEEVHLKPKQRTMHTQVVGTTNAGKTESVIIPWVIQDMRKKRGILLIDGKADRSLLDKLWAYAVNEGREKDFMLFSLGNVEESQTFNPLVGGTAEEITERIFNAFEFENPFYRSIQFEVLSQVLRIFLGAGVAPTFIKLHQAISSPMILEELVEKQNDPLLRHWVTYFRNLSGSERDQRTAGLTSQIGHFAFGKSAVLFNAEKPAITIDDALRNNMIVYFQLPALLSPFLGKASGKLVLQSLQAAIANRHLSGERSHTFFSVMLDDFSEYLTPGFVTVLNKSRSANVGIVFAHQSMGDIDAMGPAVANAISTNSNVKIFMRGNDPDSAEHFAKVVGTRGEMKFTERRKIGFWKDEGTGDVSARDVEAFVRHPNKFKRALGVGQAVLMVPHDGGTTDALVRFQMFPDIEAATPLPRFNHERPVVLVVPKDPTTKERSREEPFLQAMQNQPTQKRGEA